MTQVIVFVFVLLLFVYDLEGNLEDKRLLLTDLDVVQHRLDQMDSKVQSLQNDLLHEKQTVQQLKSEQDSQKQNIKHLTSLVNQQAYVLSAGRTTYVRWGKHLCSDNATLVYSGQVGGTYFDSTGGASNPLCMVHEVIFGNPINDKFNQEDGAELHGAEYKNDFWGVDARNKDVPCAVCIPKSKSTTLMLPGRNKCLTDWTEEYHGYLSANWVNFKHTSTYICVDENVEFLDGGTQKENGYLLYSVNAKCGSLKCPPYIDNRPITCVVCSK